MKDNAKNIACSAKTVAVHDDKCLSLWDNWKAAAVQVFHSDDRHVWVEREKKKIPHQAAGRCLQKKQMLRADNTSPKHGG